MAAPEARAPESVIRLLIPGDELVIEGHLARHWSSSMPLCANFRAGGLSDEGEYNQGSYAAVFEGVNLVAIAAHFRDGTLMLQAPRAAAQAVRAAVDDSGRMVERIMGPWSQVNGAAASLSNDPRKPFTGKPNTLLTIQMSKLRADTLKPGDARARLATRADVPTLTQWRAAQDAAAPGAVSPLRPELEAQIAAMDLTVAELIPPEGPRIVAVAACEAWLSDAVQIGGVYSPPALKDKLYGPVAVLGAALAAKKRGAHRVALMADKTQAKALEAYRALGFVALEEFGVLAAPE